MINLVSDGLNTFAYKVTIAKNQNGYESSFRGSSVLFIIIGGSPNG